MKKDITEYLQNIRDNKPAKLVDLNDFVKLMQVLEPEVSYNCYKGIRRTIFPKWRGWTIINEYRRKGVKAVDIVDSELDVLVNEHLTLMMMKMFCE